MLGLLIKPWKKWQLKKDIRELGIEFLAKRAAKKIEVLHGDNLYVSSLWQYGYYKYRRLHSTISITRSATNHRHNKRTPQIKCDKGKFIIGRVIYSQSEHL